MSLINTTLEFDGAVPNNAVLQRILNELAAAIASAGGGSGTPGGSDTQVQFNDAGAFDGDDGFVYDKATGHAAIGPGIGAANSFSTLYIAEAVQLIAGTGILLEAYAADTANSSVSGAFITAGTASGATQDPNQITGASINGSSTLGAGRTISGIFGLVASGESNGDGTALEANGVYGQCVANAGVINTGKAFYGKLYDLGGGSGVGHGYGFYAHNAITVPLEDYFGFWMHDANADATNPYFLWCDSPGVYRVKADGVMAYYNPTFTKYTPGATNYERITIKWNSDVAEIGTEANGTGTLRDVNIICDALTVNGTPVSSFTPGIFATGAGHTVDQLITYLQSIGLCTQT